MAIAPYSRPYRVSRCIDVSGHCQILSRWRVPEALSYPRSKEHTWEGSEPYVAGVVVGGGLVDLSAAITLRLQAQMESSSNPLTSNGLVGRSHRLPTWIGTDSFLCRA
jgi:hypothetical protein